MVKENQYKTGNLLEVVLKDGKQFKCIVVEDYGDGFVGKVLSKDLKVGTASWNRYGLKEDGRFQVIENCKEVKVLAESTETKGSGSLSLNESVTKSEMTYYTTPLGEGKCITLCLCEGYGGWSVHDENEDAGNALKESFFSSQISKCTNK